MSDGQAGATAKTQFLEKLKTPWLLPDSEKVWMTSVLVICLMLPFVILVDFSGLNPKLFPFLDQGFLSILLHWLHGVFGCWVFLFFAGLFSRKHPKLAYALTYFLCQLYIVGFSVIAYFIGPFTTDIVGSVLFAGSVFGFLLFDKWVTYLALLSGVLILSGVTISAQLGWIPYAPVFATSPVQDSTLHNSWLWGGGGLFLVVLFVLGGVIIYFLYRLRDRELALSRASELIGRYVPVQVATAIMSGEGEAVNAHERRRLTVFFSDLVGFTEITERLDPEDLSRVLNEYFTEMSTIAERYDGTVDDLVGDAILIFFGAPDSTSDSDQALRAVRMAMEMQTAIERLNKGWAQAGLLARFQARMGIDTGYVTVGNFGTAGRMKYSVMGEHVNLAARLQQHAEPGEILLSENTWVLVRDQIDCKPRDELELKGISRPVPTHCVVLAE